MCELRLGNHPIPPLLLLQTDVPDTELLFQRMTEGESSCVFLRIPYEAPEHDFTGIRKLILAVSGKRGMRSTFRGLVGIDITAWKNHEKEEYFQILEKYLYDNSREWQLVFLISGYSRHETARLRYYCVNYFAIQQEGAFVYEEKNLERHLKNTFASSGMEIEEAAAKELQKALSDERIREFRSLQLLERVVSEMIADLEPRFSQEGNRCPGTAGSRYTMEESHYPDTAGSRYTMEGSHCPDTANRIYTMSNSLPVITLSMVQEYLRSPFCFLAILEEMNAGMREEQNAAAV